MRTLHATLHEAIARTLRIEQPALLEDLNRAISLWTGIKPGALA
jgi:hypothetical protein